MMIKFTEAANEVSTKVTKARRLLVSKQPAAASVDTWKSAWTNDIKKKVNALFIHHYHDGKQKSKGSLQADKEFNDLIEEVVRSRGRPRGVTRSPCVRANKRSLCRRSADVQPPLHSSQPRWWGGCLGGGRNPLAVRCGKSCRVIARSALRVVSTKTVTKARSSSGPPGGASP